MKKLYLVLVILTPVWLNAQTVFVDVNNETGTENGSAEFPYKSLSDGIEAAQAGDTLFIRNGLYDPAPYTYFRLKDGVITMGEDSAKTIINANFENTLATMNHYTELSNLKCNEIGLGNGDGSATLVIKNCAFKNIGFASGSGYTFIVENCTIENDVTNTSGENYWFVENCVIKNGQISDSGRAPEGIEAHIIENNEITYKSNPDNSYDFAIYASSQSITVKNNKITCLGKSSGMRLSTFSPTNVIGNTILLEKAGNLNEDNFYGIRTYAGDGIVTGNTINGGTVGYSSGSGATLFADNEITNAYYGFLSGGAEEVCRNKISNCTFGIVTGFRGPVHNNIIMNNDSIGIYYISSVDLGGGNFNGPGRNIIKGNGWYDLVIPNVSQNIDTLFAKYNVWDHDNLEDILQYDILNNGGENLTLDFSENITTPASPQLKSPENATTETDTSLNLSWQESTGAEFYKIQVSETSDFNTVFLEQDSISTLNFTVDSLNFNTTYYWRCMATNLAGESDWSETWSFQTKVATGIKEIKSSVEMRVYPNPVSGKLYIEAPTGTTTFNFKILDIHGRIIHSQKSFSGKSIVVSDLPTGVYYISLQNKKESYNARFVKK